MPSSVTLTYNAPSSDQTHLEGTYLTDDNLMGRSSRRFFE